MKKSLFTVAAVLLLTTATAPALAAQMIDLSFNGEGVAAMATLTISDDAVSVNGRDAYTVTGITGSRNGIEITGLNYEFPVNFGGPDQFLFLTEAPFTDLGLSYNLSDGSFGNIYYSSGFSEGISFDLVTAPFGSEAEYTLTNLRPASVGPVTGAVPEPATWALMMVGFGVAGATIRRQRKVQAAVRFA